MFFFLIHKRPWLLIAGFLCIGLGDAFLSGSLEAWVAEEYRKGKCFELLKLLFSKVRVLSPLIGVVAGVVGSFLSTIYLGLLLLLSSLTLLVALSIMLFTFEEKLRNKILMYAAFEEGT